MLLFINVSANACFYYLLLLPLTACIMKLFECNKNYKSAEHSVKRPFQDKREPTSMLLTILGPFLGVGTFIGGGPTLLGFVRQLVRHQLRVRAHTSH